MTLYPRPIALALSIVLGLFAHASAAAPGEWSRVGPNTGFYYAARFAPGSNTLAIAVSEGGVYRSTDGGANWSLTLRAPYAQAQSLAFDPAGSNRAFVAINNGLGGVHVTEDGGLTYVDRTTGMTDSYISALAVSADGSRIYAGGANKGVFHSTDHGITWTAGATGLPPQSIGATNFAAIRALAVDALDPALVYAATDSATGLYRSVDGGATWSPKSSFDLFQPSVCSVAASPTVANTLFITGLSGTFRSVDGGDNWTTLPTPNTDPGTTFCTIKVDPTTPTTVYLGDGGNGFVYRSTDSGDTWTEVDAGLETSGVLDLDISTADSSRLLAGTMQGIFRSSNAGVAWAPATNGLLSALISKLLRDPATPGVLYAGDSNQGLWKSTDDGHSFFRADVGIPYHRGHGNIAFYSIAISPTDPQTLLVGVLDSPWVSAAGLYRSLDGGGSWAPYGGTTMLDRSVFAIAFAPSDAQVVFAAGRKAGVTEVFRSGDGGATWQNVSAGLPANAATFDSLAVDPSDANKVFVVGGVDGSFRSTTGGASWLPMPVAGIGLFARVDPRAPHALYMGMVNGLKRSTDGGASFTQILPVTFGTAPLAYGLDFHPTRPDSLLVAGVGDDAGGYFSDDAGATWQKLEGFEITHYAAYGAAYGTSGAARILLAIGARGVNAYELRSDLNLALTQDPSNVLAIGATIRGTVHVTNSGPDPAYDLRLIVTFPSSYSSAAVALAGGSCTVLANVHTCTLDRMTDDGQPYDLTFSATPSAAGTGLIEVAVDSVNGGAGQDTLIMQVVIPATPPPSGGGGSGGGGAFGLELMVLLGLVARRRRGQGIN